MASTSAHHATGIPAGLIAAALVHDAGAGGPFHVLTLLAVVAGLLGGTAPDWLEVHPLRRRKLWITHRTWTHWGVAWIGLLAWSFQQLAHTPWAPPAFGFALGGLFHLLADSPNPRGIPWFWGTHRLSLHLWKSGRCDVIVVTLAWLGALVVCDRVLFEGVHLAWAAGRLKAA